MWGAWLLLFPIAAAFKAPLLIHHARYAMPLIPLYIAAGLIGWHLVERARVRAVLLALMLGFVLLRHGMWAGYFVRDALSIKHEHLAAARWVRENVPEGEAVAANDIGAISYLSGRRVVDLCGIVTGDILRILEIKEDVAARHRLIRDYLMSRGVRYLVIYPDWFAMIIQGSPFRRVHTIYYPFNTIGGSSKMEVYKIP
jgi:hypothetical protein